MADKHKKRIILGSGIPAICIPIVEKEKEGILKEARRLNGYPCDLVEWRADFFEGWENHEAVAEVLDGLRGCLGERGILFPFRTADEGGNSSITPEAYAALNRAAASTGVPDFIDVELIRLGDAGGALVHDIQRQGVQVIGSNHDFAKTPEKQELIGRLTRMQSLGADVAKLAVMPQSKADVITLLDATREKKRQSPDYPIITMSMGRLGMPSRLTGALYGSALTFGTAGQASAPGQIPAELLAEVLQLLGE